MTIQRFTILLFALWVMPMAYGQSGGETLAKPANNTQKQKIKVFPNPATNVVNILGLRNSIRADIVVSDMYGHVVLRHQWQIRNKALNIPISTLSPGIYRVAIRSQEQNVQAKFYKK